MSFWEGTGMTFGSVCNQCYELYDKAKLGQRDAIETLEKYINIVNNVQAKEVLLKLQELGLDENQLQQLKDERQRERDEEQRVIAEKELEQQKKYEKFLQHAESVMMNTGYNFEGYDIVDYCGIVSAESVLGTGFLSELSLSVNDFLGTMSRTYQTKIAVAKKDAQDKLKVIAASNNANAIIGIDFDILTLTNNAIVVSANGTAVKIVKKKC